MAAPAGGATAAAPLPASGVPGTGTVPGAAPSALPTTDPGPSQGTAGALPSADASTAPGTSATEPTSAAAAAAASAEAPDSGSSAEDEPKPDAVAQGPSPEEVSGRPCHSMHDWTPQPDDLWIAPDGDDENPGSEPLPKQSLAAAIQAWSAGQTVWVQPGTYAHSAPVQLTVKATAESPLRISGLSRKAKPVFDFSGETRSRGNNGERGFHISGAYVHLRYLEIANAADNCVYVTGENNTLEWLTVHDCQDTGVQLSNGAAHNQVLNVDSYLNADPSGENADGFAPKLSIGQGNYFCGTRAYHNADDGYDCWAAGDSSPVTFEYCWAFGQPGPTATAAGDGNGFKLGSPRSRASGGNAPHELIDCFAFHNRSVGFTANGNSSGRITCTGCGVWANGAPWSPGGAGGQLPQHSGDITNLDVTIDEARSAPRDPWGNLPEITNL